MKCLVTGRVGDYNDFSPVTLQQGRNVLLVAVITRVMERVPFLGLNPAPNIQCQWVSATLFPQHQFIPAIPLPSTSALKVSPTWQVGSLISPSTLPPLKPLSVTEGDFLKTDSGNTFFQSGSIDNAAGKITGLSAIRLSTQGVTGTGTVLQVTFKAKSPGETELTLQNFEVR